MTPHEAALDYFRRGLVPVPVGVDTFMAGNKYKLFDWFYAKIRGVYKRGGKK